jgi:pimeloyl-ACP methyl ester carboxylesterase
MTAMTTEQTNRPGGVTAVLARRIPGAAYRVIAGAGHLTSMEQPAAVSDLLARFVTELDR